MTGSPMKIAILTSGILPIPAIQGGAVETLVDFYLDYNDKHCLHDITVYSVWHPDVEKDPALKSKVNHYKYIKIEGWWAKIKRNIYHLIQDEEYYHYSIEYFLHEAIKDIRHQQYDVIILENRPGYSLKLNKQTNAKIIYHLHNDNLNSSISNSLFVYNNADRIITVSDFIRRQVMTINPRDTKTATVLNGIDLAIFTPCSDNNKKQHDDFIIVFSGRLIPEKGILQLIQAMQLLKDYQDIKLVIIGSGSLGKSKQLTPFQQQLQEVAKDMNNIHFTGYLAYHDMTYYLHQADVAVLPSTWEEPFGLTMAEAQAAGLPIITTKQGGILEVVSKQNAILLDTNENFVENLAAAILDLYEHPEKRKQMAAAALERSKLFDKDTYAKNFFKALEMP